MGMVHRQGADRVAKELALFFQLQCIENPPAVIETVATSGTGLEALADALVEYSFSALYCSPILRALETAQIVGRRLGLTPQVADGLR